MITEHDYWMGRDSKYRIWWTEEIQENGHETIRRVNLLLDRFFAAHPAEEPSEYGVNSGWRPAAVNRATPNAAPKSKHVSAQACDISDPEGLLDEWCIDHPEVLEEIGMWQESPSATKAWAHLQIVPPRSGKRVFMP